MRRSNAALFWPVVAVIVAVDILTKAWAVAQFTPYRFPREVIGEWLRFTLVYNPGAAFGLSVGPYSRWIFTVLTVVALAILGRLFVRTEPGHWVRVTALALVVGGAIGNLLDRLRSERGVVDFIDIGFGAARWPTFNIADIAVSTGAIILAVVLWQEEQELEKAAAATAAPPVATGAGTPVPSESGEPS
jgi:signal peptidase II